MKVENSDLYDRTLSSISVVALSPAHRRQKGFAIATAQGVEKEEAGNNYIVDGN
jgi:hypothetical protein